MKRNKYNKYRANVTRKAGRPKKSNYARKREYLNRNGGYGFDYPEPKPWKS